MDVPVDCVFAREEGDETYPLEGYRADISRAAFEALLSELPMRFVCREDCKGLCPVCGRNRNTNPCDCLEGARGAPGCCPCHATRPPTRGLAPR